MQSSAFPHPQHVECMQSHWISSCVEAIDAIARGEGGHFPYLERTSTPSFACERTHDALDVVVDSNDAKPLMQKRVLCGSVFPLLLWCSTLKPIRTQRSPDSCRSCNTTCDRIASVRHRFDVDLHDTCGQRSANEIFSRFACFIQRHLHRSLLG